MNKAILKVLALGVAVAASTTLAKADQIGAGSSVSVTGPSVYDQSSETVTFPTTGTYTINGLSTNDFKGFTAGQQITWLLEGGALPLGNPSSSPSSPVYNMPPGGSLPVFTAMEGGQTLAFTLTSEYYVPSSFAGLSSVDVYGTGNFDLSGYDTTPGSFEFTINNATGLMSGSFSGTGITQPVAPTPEPSSLALLGTGLLSAAAVARRRFSGRISA